VKNVKEFCSAGRVIAMTTTLGFCLMAFLLELLQIPEGECLGIADYMPDAILDAQPISCFFR